MEEEIKSIIEMKNEMEQAHEAKPFDPVMAVEESLYSFLKYRLDKLKKDMDFQDQIKNFLTARLPEADFNDLRVLLQQEQQNTNASSQGILNPFLPKAQEGEKKGRTKQIEEEIFENSSKENLQNFNELFQLFSELKKEIIVKKDTVNIKQALESSLEEK
jgi:hypothetical protein